MGLGDKRLDGDEAKMDEFFRLMKRQFTQDEWMQIQSKDKGHQLAVFFRFWCLKESYVKGLGTGLGWDLQRLSFVLKSEWQRPSAAASATPPRAVTPPVGHAPLGATPRVALTNDIIKDTQLYIDSELATDWAFEETLLDRDHCVTTALKYNQDLEQLSSSSLNFSLLTCESLLNGLHPIANDYDDRARKDQEEWLDFQQKIEHKPF
jgi:4'-phosphopantetheinyl transferase